ncbi:MAG: NUDIX hydrolase [Candidatus Chisholmbacteria bacterium]|nr:NUDIX hydrolase [Candidatus Chisholmbacteria bacterium]
MKPIKSVGIVVVDKQKVLLVKHGPSADHFEDKYGIPSGKLLHGETNIQTAVRELKEESGLTTFPKNLKPLHLFKATFNTKKGLLSYDWQTYHCLS